MLKNDPPAGTTVKFVREVKKAKTQETARLLRAIRKYEVERPSDEFEVDFRGERMVVQRQDIE
jgi:hypothetical protein